MKNQVSLLIPIHGDSPFLGATLQSVSESTLKRFDLIIVLDRCSNPDLKLHLHKIPNSVSVKIYTSTEPGIVAALNLGLSKISTKYVARLDADDEIFPERLIKQLLFLESHPEVVCVGSQLALINEKSENIGFTRYPTSHEDIKKRMIYQNCLAHPSVMFQREMVAKVGNYRKFLEGAEDYDLWMRLMKVGALSNIDEKLTRYRVSDHQVTRKNSNAQELLDNCVRLSNLISSTAEGFSGRISREATSLNLYYEEYSLILRKSSLSKYRLLKSAQYLNFYVRDLGKTERKWYARIPMPVLKSLLYAPIGTSRYVLESLQHRAKRKIGRE